MLHRDFAARRARGGRGLLPPNPKQWNNEHNGIELREKLALGREALLDHEAVFALLPNVTVLPHGELPMAQMYIDFFRGQGLGAWSGMGIPLPDGGTMVIFNDAHKPNRIRATLMEEFFHLWLGHPATSVRLYSEGAHRNHDPRVESEAYGSGAAALVPYTALKQMLQAGKSVRWIATAFGVSTDLVVFRTKVTKLYSLLRRA